ncbi:MAG: glutamyl-tRNA reductase [Elusimicrobia bacterium]|nr:glutamyl-tRNA reductase [Elusimicrobiota bacterium]
MQLVLVGVSHKSGSLDLRESLGGVSAEDALRRLKDAGWSECVVLATCNRFEVYAATSNSGDVDALATHLQAWSNGRLEQGLYSRRDGEAVSHLFAVAAGLDSLVVGEAEILGQVKQAYQAASAAGLTGKLTNVLFQRALHVGKLVRSDTGVSSGQLSVASVAVTLAERIFGDLHKSSVLILGAGTMAELTARHLLSAKVSRLHIANRTWEKARTLASALEAEPVRWEDFPRLLESVDIVIGSTGASEPVLTKAMVEEAIKVRQGRSLFIIDIAMPRDAESSIDEFEHAYLYSLEDLEGLVRENLSMRRKEIEAAETLVGAKSAEFAAWLQEAAAGRQAALRHSADAAPRS